MRGLQGILSGNLRRGPVKGLLALPLVLFGAYEVATLIIANNMSGFGGIVVEMGIGGLILWLIMTVAILLSAWKIVLRLRGSPWFPVSFVVFLYAGFLLVPQMVGGIPCEDFVMNAYLWLLLGVLFRLPHLKLGAEVAHAENISANQQQPRWVT